MTDQIAAAPSGPRNDPLPRLAPPLPVRPRGPYVLTSPTKSHRCPTLALSWRQV